MENTAGLKPKDKWCPMARLAILEDSGVAGSANRFPGGVGLGDEWLRVRCLGGACAVFVGDDASGHCGLIRA